MTRRTAILGTGQLARELATELCFGRHGRYRLLGTINDKPNASSDDFPCPCLGEVSELHSIVKREKVRRIVLALDDNHTQCATDRLLEAQTHQHIVIETGTDVMEKLTGRFPLESFFGSYDLFSDAFRYRPISSLTCRLTSLAIAIIGLPLCFPLMTIMAVAIRLDSPGPVLFIQERTGYGGKRFRLYKFRSMYTTDAKRSEWIEDNENAITRVGHWLRKFRMDELPQFINVIRGDMNVVGPRPHPSSNHDLFTLVARNIPSCGTQIPYYSIRHSVRPGITGWAQVRYKYANGLIEELEKLKYDLYYVKYYSPLLDLSILLRTIKIVLLGRNANVVAKPRNLLATETSGAGSKYSRPRDTDFPDDSYREDRGLRTPDISQLRKVDDQHLG